MSETDPVPRGAFDRRITAAAAMLALSFDLLRMQLLAPDSRYDPGTLARAMQEPYLLIVATKLVPLLVLAAWLADRAKVGNVAALAALAVALLQTAQTLVLVALRGSVMLGDDGGSGDDATSIAALLLSLVWCGWHWHVARTLRRVARGEPS
ncbi:MAG: hypothetical protein R3F34_06575 [Planctomycetota bacterium]